MPKNILEDMLVSENLLTKENLVEAKGRQRGAKRPLQDILVEMGFIAEKEMLEIMSRAYGMPVVSFKKDDIDSEVSVLVPYELAKKYGVLPVRKEGEHLLLAMSNPLDVIAVDDVKLLTNMDVMPVMCPKSNLAELIESVYQSDESLYDLFSHIVASADIDVLRESKEKQESALKDTKQGPVMKLVTLFLTDAIKARASDIHIEAGKDKTKIRYRIDGDLREVMEIPSKLHSFVISCIKVMASLDLAETRKPQDGRTKIYLSGRYIDMRVSMVPTHFGEKAVLRILDATVAHTDLDALGFSEKEMTLFRKSIARPQGIILVSGPTGSGKTSTLYATLNAIKCPTKNIITIEDPIEYLMDGVNQIQVNPVKDVTFANGLRSILRQDPNVILVGEIRDLETAEISFKASLTGHLVLSTIHTNSSVASVTRLLNLGLEPYLIGSSLTLVIAQRLVRVNCEFCRDEYQPAPELVEKYLGSLERHRITRFMKGKGCARCNFSGYLGRTGVFEMLEITKKIRTLIAEKAGEDVILKEALRGGMTLLADSAFIKLKQGITTLEEVAKRTDVSESEDEKALPRKREKPLILIVEDEPDLARILGITLEDAGYDTIRAANGAEGVEMAVRERPDLAILDVMMPEMDGFEAVRQLRSRIETAVIPIMMLTAVKDKASEVKGLDLGADDYVTKPFDTERLLARIRLLLKRRT
ncbi:MAG TPA: ATPase, T2SS/T4P/T4SS family [bacterium]|nr:ATPase, T2SS/T4P/T4SS family [bacterium]